LKKSGDVKLRCNVLEYSSILLCYSHAGPKGVPGPAGYDGPSGRVLPSGNIIVRHSQTNTVPRCPPGGTALWDGYSLLHIEGNEHAHSQDLGGWSATRCQYCVRQTRRLARQFVLCLFVDLPTCDRMSRTRDFAVNKFYSNNSID